MSGSHISTTFWSSTAKFCVDIQTLLRPSLQPHDHTSYFWSAANWIRILTTSCAKIISLARIYLLTDYTLVILQLVIIFWRQLIYWSGMSNMAFRLAHQLVDCLVFIFLNYFLKKSWRGIETTLSLFSSCLVFWWTCYCYRSVICGVVHCSQTHG